MPTDFTAPGLDTGYGDQRPDPVLRDPDLGDLDRDEPSDLEDLRAELEAEVTPTTVIENLGRPRYAVRFRTDFTGRDLDSLRKKAKDKRFKDGIDGIRFASLLLGLTCVEVLRDGKPLADIFDASSPVTFTSRELQELMGTNAADTTVRKFYGREGYVDAAARRLMDEAGWGDEAYAADPTE